MHRNAGKLAAVVGIAAVVTAGMPWLEVGVAWCVALLLRLVLPVCQSQSNHKAGAVLNIILCALLIAAITLASEQAFPQDSTFPMISIAMLLLLWRSMIGDKENGVIVSNVLGLMVLPVMAVVVALGLKNCSWAETIPTGLSWKNILVAVGVFSPWWWKRHREESWLWPLLSAALTIGMSVLTYGTLGSGLVQNTPNALYRTVETIQLGGMVQHMESLLASVVLLGTFAMLLTVGDILRESVEILAPEGQKAVTKGSVLLLSFALETLFWFDRESMPEVCITIFWVLVLVFALWVVVLAKVTKTE